MIKENRRLVLPELEVLTFASHMEMSFSSDLQDKTVIYKGKSEPNSHVNERKRGQVSCNIIFANPRMLVVG